MCFKNYGDFCFQQISIFMVVTCLSTTISMIWWNTQVLNGSKINKLCKKRRQNSAFFFSTEWCPNHKESHRLIRMGGEKWKAIHAQAPLRWRWSCMTQVEGGIWHKRVQNKRHIIKHTLYTNESYEHYCTVNMRNGCKMGKIMCFLKEPVIIKGKSFRQKDTVRAGEERPAGQQFGHDAPDGPDVHRLVVVHPVEHDLRRPVPPGRHVTGHFVLRRSGQTKVENFKLAIFVDGNVGRL